MNHSKHENKTCKENITMMLIRVIEVKYKILNTQEIYFSYNCVDSYPYQFIFR